MRVHSDPIIGPAPGLTGILQTMHVNTETRNTAYSRLHHAAVQTRTRCARARCIEQFSVSGYEVLEGVTGQNVQLDIDLQLPSKVPNQWPLL